MNRYKIYNQNTTGREFQCNLTQTSTCTLALKLNKMAEVEKNWSDEQLQSEDVSKKDIIKFLHENASFEVWKTYFMGCMGCIFGSFDRILQRGSVVFRQTMGNLILQTKTFYSHSEHFMPVLIAVCFFLIKRITHWHISFSVTRLLTLIFLRAKDGAIFHAPYHTPARKCFCITWRSRCSLLRCKTTWK